MTCSSFLSSLRSLTLINLPMMVNLPNWMRFLPTLENLEIRNCRKLKAMPNWMPKLTSLKQLHVEHCLKSLTRNCKKDLEGEDWPYIQHIPNIQFRGRTCRYAEGESSDELSSTEESCNEDD